MRAKVELYERIRRDHAQHKWGVRRLAKEHHCHRREVRQALTSALPPTRTSMVRERPKLGPLLAAIDAMLTYDLTAPRKQRHSAHRIWTRLVSENEAAVAESTVRQYVRQRRRELGQHRPETMVPQVHEAGDEAEMDLYEAVVQFAWGREKVQFFEMRACHSGASFHWPLRTVHQQAFLEAHVHAFEHFGGVFARIRYDNLAQAVRKVLRGRSRLESERFVVMRSHYGFAAEFCQPGLRGAHEKGGVEGEVGYFRRNHLVPVPEVADWEHLVDHCQFGMNTELSRHVDGRAASIGDHWAAERSQLRPLPADRFDTRLHMTARVDAKSRVSVLRNRYSVPSTLSGMLVEVAADTLAVVMRSGGREVARHRRVYGIGHDRLVLDHYLEVLHFKPRALAGSLPLRQAIDDGSFPSSYTDFHRHLVGRLGESEGARQMVDVLMLHRHYGPVLVISAVEQALDAGAYDHAAVALLARALAEPPRPALRAPPLQLLTSPQVPIPDCRHYDQLLTRGDD